MPLTQALVAIVPRRALGGIEWLAVPSPPPFARFSGRDPLMRMVAGNHARTAIEASPLGLFVVPARPQLSAAAPISMPARPAYAINGRQAETITIRHTHHPGRRTRPPRVSDERHAGGIWPM